MPGIGRIMGRKMCRLPWRILGVYVTVMLLVVGDVAAAISLPPIHWNASNPMFKTSNNDHIIEVNLYDDIDFVCPHGPDGSTVSEYYVIHQVSEREYKDCNIYSPNTAMVIVNCSSPRQKKRFTILFEPFQSIPNVPEYHPGGTYYFISTSTGEKEGISNPHQGACVYRNMKLTIQVCCESTTRRPVIMSTTTKAPPPAPSSAPVPSDPAHPVHPRWSSTLSPHTDKPPDENKDKEEDKNKDENEIDSPKHEGLVNSARTLEFSWSMLLGTSLAFLLVFHPRR